MRETMEIVAQAEAPASIEAVSRAEIEPRISEIKSLLNNGVKVAGVNAVRIQKSGVRLKAVKMVEI